MSKKKLLTSAVALGTAAALTLGGTFAWQSISQGAVNEASDQVNPGGRLHNDLTYVDAKTTDANIYVENFTDEKTGDDIFARVRLSEYMEIVMNYGSKAETVETVAGAKYEIGEGNTRGDLADNVATEKNTYDYDYAVHYFGLNDEEALAGTEKNKTYAYWTLKTGDENSDAVYMPTFNKNKDSLAADLNGLYDGRVGGITNRGEAQYANGHADYEENDKETAWAIYDGDWNSLDELDDLTIEELHQIIYGTDNDIDGGGENADSWQEDFAKAVKLTKEEHTAAKVGETRGLIALSDWLELTENTDSYWVYDDSKDDDGNPTGGGWVYWSSAIKPGTTTGLLLDSFTLNEVMDDTWYYAIDVTAQFVTANDLGRGNKTGFYTSEDDQPTENAEKLLKAIGVTLDEKDDTPVMTMVTGDNTGYVSMKKGDSIRLKEATGNTPTELTWFATYGGDYEMVEGTDYTYENGVLTILADSETHESLNAYGTRLIVQSRDSDWNTYGGSILLEDDGELTLSYDEENEENRAPDVTIAPINKGVTVLKQDGTALDSDSIAVWKQNAYSGEGNEHYTYDATTGVLTITDPDWVGTWLEIKGDGSGYLIVTAASTSGGNSSDGGAQPDEDEDTTPKTYQLELSKDIQPENGEFVVAVASVKNGDTVTLKRTEEDGDTDLKAADIKLNKLDGTFTDEECVYHEDTGVLELNVMDDYPTGGAMTVQWNEMYGHVAAIIQMNDDGNLDLKENYIDTMVCQLGQPIDLRLNGTAITATDLEKTTWSYTPLNETQNGMTDITDSDYTFADGTVTFSNSACGDSMIAVEYEGDDGESYMGVIFLLNKLTLATGTPTSDLS